MAERNANTGHARAGVEPKEIVAYDFEIVSIRCYTQLS